MERIKEIREQLRLSRREFSELYEIPYNTLAQWERGERCAPGYVIKLIEEIIKVKTKEEQLSIFDKTYYSGYVRYNGKNETNLHSRNFNTIEESKAWQENAKEMIKRKELTKAYLLHKIEKTIEIIDIQ